MEIRPGQHLLGRYTIVERLGFGGMGEVWRARDDVLDREVAVKALARHLVANEDARERFRREAQLAGSLSHDHVVAVHDAGTQGDAMVLVMELIDGGSLSMRLRDGERSGVDEAVRVATEILAGLSAAHEAGLVHRDVKPANVMFTSAGRVKLTDFGIARLSATETTRTAEVYGSAPYIAPERANGHPAMPASDVYAVGCVFYEMLTGVSPFTGDTPAVTIARHLQYQPPPPSQHNPDVPPAVDAIVMRALSKDPAARYADAGEMLADLRHAVRTGQVAPATVALTRPLTLAERRAARADPTMVLPADAQARDLTLWWGVAAGVVILLLLLGLVRWLGSDATPGSGIGGDAVGASPVATAPDTTTTSPAAAAASPEPSESTNPPQTVDEAVTALRREIAVGRRDGEISARGVDDLEKKLADVLDAHREGKDDDVAKRVEALGKELDKRIEDGDVTGGATDALRELVVRLGELA